MKQALHILRKDIRYLRLEIGLLLLLAGLYVLTSGMGWPGAVLELAGVYLVVRVIHAEAIPGDRQFWLTRPYSPISLCGAKFLFIFVCICLPIGIAQTAIVLKLGFPLGHEIPALLCMQLLLFFGAGLPVAALAATTASTAPLILTILALVITTLIGGLADARFLNVPDVVDWISTLALGAVLSAASAVVVFWQYRDRRTLFSRVFGLMAFFVAVGAYFWLPPQWPLEQQIRLSKEPSLSSGVRVGVDLAKRRVVTSEGYLHDMHISLPLVVGGLPEGAQVMPDYLSVSFEWPDLTWSPARRLGANARLSSQGEVVLDTPVSMDVSLFNAKSKTPLTIRGTVYLTLFGEPERRSLPLRRGPANAQDGLQCYAQELEFHRDYIQCRSMFRWPSRLVRAEAHGGIIDIGNIGTSYSPLPAGLISDLVHVRWGEPVDAAEAVIVTTKPLVHFRRDFEARGIRLAYFRSPVHEWSPIDGMK